MQALKEIIEHLKVESLTLLLCCRDRRIPLYAKIPAIIAVGLFFSPVDLIPDFIPVLGHIDDIIIIPLLIKFTIRLIPAPLFDENRKKAGELINTKQPVMRTAAVIIILLWITVTGFVLLKIFTWKN
ncbi:MAG TPA: DUF1232 domain-containing protein [Spirochaetota bacterium]|nr:DUF1232 domain-containing protein [Spirochaetota bacterium]